MIVTDKTKHTHNIHLASLFDGEKKRKTDKGTESIFYYGCTT